MKQKLPADWVRTIKKHMDRLKAAECFEDFLRVGLGQPEQLEGYKQIRYSVRVTGNVRLILEPNATQETVMICSEIEVEGVSVIMVGKITGISRDLIIHPGETIATFWLIEYFTSRTCCTDGVSAAYISSIISGKKEFLRNLPWP